MAVRREICVDIKNMKLSGLAIAVYVRSLVFIFRMSCEAKNMIMRRNTTDDAIN